MAGRFVLARETKKFADQMGALLTGTVGCGVRLRCTEIPRAEQHYGIRSERPLPLRPDVRDRPSAFLRLNYVVSADKTSRFLMVRNSMVGVSDDPDGRKLYLHYDYEREKGGGYPEAHLQVHATSDRWEAFSSRSLPKLHLPVGGRRYRPCLEDIIEFLIVEGLATGRNGWEKLVEKGREEYRRIQTKAAIRADQGNLTDFARSLGWTTYTQPAGI